MGEITALEPQKRNPKRVNLFVDGKFAVGLDLETVLKEDLKIGQEISQEKIKHLVEISDRQKILDKAFRFLSFRPRSQKETLDFLLRKKVDEKESGWAIEQLKKGNYLNDEEFARWWVEQRTTFRPTGWRLLKMELRQKGVGEEVIKGIRNPPAGEASQGSGISEQELAKRVVEKKSKSLSHLPAIELKQKLAAHLARRGFEWETIKAVVDEIVKRQ